MMVWGSLGLAQRMRATFVMIVFLMFLLLRLQNDFSIVQRICLAALDALEALKCRK